MLTKREEIAKREEIMNEIFGMEEAAIHRARGLLKVIRVCRRLEQTVWNELGELAHERVRQADALAAEEDETAKEAEPDLDRELNSPSTTDKSFHEAVARRNAALRAWVMED